MPADVQDTSLASKICAVICEMCRGDVSFPIIGLVYFSREKKLLGDWRGRERPRAKYANASDLFHGYPYCFTGFSLFQFFPSVRKTKQEGKSDVYLRPLISPITVC